MTAQRQAIISSIGKVIWLVLTVAAPPPLGVIVGAVVRGVMCEDDWVSGLSTAGTWVMQAPLQSNPGGSTEYAHINVPGGFESLNNLKDMTQAMGGIDKCLGKTWRERFDEINKKTLKHMMDMPAPPKKQADGFSGVVQEQCNRKIKAIALAVSEVVAEFASSYSGSISLIQASWEYQEESIASKLQSVPEAQRSAFVRDRIRDGCQLYLNTVASQILTKLAAMAKPKFNTASINKKKVKEQLRFYFGRAIWQHPQSRNRMRRAHLPAGRL